MANYEAFSSSKGSTKCILWCLILIFLTTLTTFTILEVRSLSEEEPSVIRIILNSIKKSPTNMENEFTKFDLVDMGNVQQDKDNLVKAIITEVKDSSLQELERKVRDTVESNSSKEKNNTYYEEQTPVVVYSKTDQQTPLSYRQSAPVPFVQGSHEEEPYYDGEDNDGEDYVNDDNGYYRPQYDDDSREDFAGPQDYTNKDDSSEARSSQNRPNDNYYRQWYYATPSPSSVSVESSKGNRKLQNMGGSQSRQPYPLYGDDYDYMGTTHQHSTAMSEKYPQQQLQRYRPQASSQAMEKQQDVGSEMNFLTILKTIKTMWDLYQSFIAAWNSMAEKHNQQEELAQQKLKQKQQEQRINSKKPPKMENKKKPENSTKNPKTNSKQPVKASTSTTSSTTENSSSSEEDEVTLKPQQLRKAKDEPRKGTKGDKTLVNLAESLRKKRGTEKNDVAVQSATDVGEGRYIKGDPLKGYYDFVITEGSYKFWAAFQVGTALLIIYSTFAAIYYSKVNPLVSDYDYTDYLGGARSLSGGDLDFVDDETAEGSEKSYTRKTPQGWFDWLPRTGHSLKFILDAIDKLPVDHDDPEANSGRGFLDSLIDANRNVKEDLKESKSENRAM
ncbi:uncharacterized protein LOC142226513 [Haematobia irritans]|uniref:uncharacterized protein LOC142226513 n=1 Tax=Haematobia irritans TaxID=7368 RepID=UPI003F508CB5